MKKNIEKRSDNNRLVIFEGDEIRRVSVDGEWFYSIEDVIKVLTDSVDPNGYIKDLRRRDMYISEGWGKLPPPFPLRRVSFRTLPNKTIFTT